MQSKGQGQGQFEHFRAATMMRSSQTNTSDPSDEESQLNNPSNIHRTWRRQHRSERWLVWHRRGGEVGLKKQEEELSFEELGAISW